MVVKLDTILNGSMVSCDKMNVHIHIHRQIDRLSRSVCRWVAHSLGRMVARYRSVWCCIIMVTCCSIYVFLGTEIRCHMMYMFVKICGLLFVDTFFPKHYTTSLPFCIFLRYTSVRWTLDETFAFSLVLLADFFLFRSILAFLSM